MAAADGRTAASAVSRKLDPIVAQLPEITTYFNSMQGLVDDEILTQAEVDVVINDYKQGVQAQMSAIESEETAHSAEIGVSGFVETHDLSEGIVPLAVHGSPVIAPLPPAITILKIAAIADQPALEAEVVAKKAQINGVVG